MYSIFKIKFNLSVIACFSAALFSFYDIFQLSLFNSIASDLSHSFHISSFKLGIMSSAYLWANALGLIPIGLLIDKYNVRYVAISLLTLSIIASFVIANTQCWQIVMLMRFIQGLTSATSLLTCMRMAIHCFNTRANTAIGIMVAIALCGGIFGNNIFIKLVNILGWQASVKIAGLIGLFILALMLFYLHDINTNTSIKLSFSVTPLLQKLKLIIKNYINLLLGVYLGCMSLPIFIFASLWGNLYLRQNYSLTTVQAALSSGMIFTGLLIGSPLIGTIADKIQSPKLILKAGALLSLLFILPFILRLPLSLTQITLLFFSLGVIGSMQNVTFVVIADTNHSDFISTATGTASFIENAIGALSQLIFGWLLNSSWQSINLNHLTHSLQQHYYDALLLFPAGFIICIILIYICEKNATIT